MFSTDKTYSDSSPSTLALGRTARALASGIDYCLDFATLGEYRLVTDNVIGEPQSAPAHAGRPSGIDADDIWATDVEWSTAPERTRAACSLPRARNREWARSRVNG